MSTDIEAFRVDPNDFQKDKSKAAIQSGYGCVEFKIQKSTGLRCAVKRTNETLSDEVAERSFRREIETLVNCRHPAIVPFVGFSEIKDFGYIYLVEEKNGSLQSFLEHRRKGKRVPNFNNTTKFIIAYGIAKPMNFLHAQNRIHRDLKPGNVLLDEHLHPLLTDFGTAKKINNSVSIHQTLESTTPTIMAPEFINSPEEFSNSLPIDVYSYGITLYELWTELQPFSHLKAVFQIWSAVSDGHRPKISDKVPESWKKLIEKCWSHNPKERPTFDEIVADLETNDKYYTDDMNKAEIQLYIKSISVPLSDSPPSKPEIKPDGPEKVDETAEDNTETFEDIETHTENPDLIKLREDAQTGDATSMFNYAVAQFDGTYGEPNYDEAREYALQYCKKEEALTEENKPNLATMEFYAGKCYAMSENFQIATTLLKHAVGHGNGDASFYLAELMFQGKIRYQRPSELELYYQRAADKGVPEAIKKYAYMLLYGSFNGRPDKTKALRYFKLGSDQGDPELMHMWAIRIEYGRGVEKDTEKAMLLMKLAADKGYTPAMVDYGIHLLNGINVAKNVDEARVRFQSAASKKDPWGLLWYYLMPRMDMTLDADFSELLTDSLNSNENPEAWGVYGRELVEQEEYDQALPSLFYAARGGSFNAFLCLGQLCEKESKYGDPHYYFKLASNYCHCLDTCGFSTPIQYNLYHCISCDIDICEACAKHCHADHNITEIGTKNGFKCQCGKDGFKGKCSGEFVGETPGYQHLYQCTTCCITSDNEYVCKSCAEECHKGHKLIDCGVLRDFCSCGMHKLPHNFNCRICKFNQMNQTYNACSSTKQKQRWFQCVTCGLYGSEETGFCQVCAKCCHDEHTVLDLGVKDQCCCCKYADCVFND